MTEIPTGQTLKIYHSHVCVRKTLPIRVSQHAKIKHGCLILSHTHCLHSLIIQVDIFILFQICHWEKKKEKLFNSNMYRFWARFISSFSKLFCHNLMTFFSRLIPALETYEEKIITGQIILKLVNFTYAA